MHYKSKKINSNQVKLKQNLKKKSISFNKISEDFLHLLICCFFLKKKERMCKRLCRDANLLLPLSLQFDFLETQRTLCCSCCKPVTCTARSRKLQKKVIWLDFGGNCVQVQVEQVRAGQGKSDQSKTRLARLNPSK